VVKIETSTNPAEVKQVPTGVKIVSTFYYIMSVILIIYLVLLVYTFKPIISTFGKNVRDFGVDILLLNILDLPIYLFGIINLVLVYIIVSVFLFFAVKRLWKTKKWAGIVVIIVSVFVIYPGIYIISTRLSLIVPIYLLLSVYLFYVGRGLRRLQKWSRKSGIVISVFWIISGVDSLYLFWKYPTHSSFGNNLISLIPLVINVVIATYLIFNKKSKSTFS